MNKKRVKILISLVLVVAIAIGLEMRQLNTIKSLENQNKNLNTQVEQLQTESNTSKEAYDKLLKDAQQVEEERQKLQQEVDNLKALRQKANEELALSRGLSRVTYKANTRVDVKSGITANMLNKALSGTKMAGMGQAFVDAENQYGVNAIFLTAVGALESGWGEHDLGKNNLFGYNANDGAVHKARQFSNKSEGVAVVAEALKRNYLTPGGEHYNGETIRGINIKYCSSDDWKYQVADIMNDIIRKATK